MGSTADLDVATLEITSLITGLFDVTLTDATTGALSVTGTHETHAGIEAGGTVLVGSDPIDLNVQNASVLIEAIDEGEVQTSITVDDALLLPNLTSFTDITSSITLDRDTQAFIGGGNAATTLPNPPGSPTGLVEVRALIRDGAHGGVDGDIASSLTGKHVNDVDDMVSAFIENASINAQALVINAHNTANYSANGKVAENFVTGATKAFIKDSLNVSGSAEGVVLSATDSSTFTATSSDVQFDLLDFLGSRVDLVLGEASAFNEINKDTTAQIDSSTIIGATVTVEALNDSRLGARTDALVVDDTGVDLNIFALNLAGTISANEVLGDVRASIEDSTVTASSGDVAVSADNTSLIEATTQASSKVSSIVGFAGSGSVAINAIGWDIGNLQNQGLGLSLFDALVGSDLVVTETIAEAEAFIKDSTVNAAGNVALTAFSHAQLDATVSNAAESTASFLFGARGMGISGIVSSNRVSSSAKAYIENTTAQLTVVAGGDVTLNAEDNAGILANAKVVTSSITTNDGGVGLLDNAIDVLSADYITDGDDVTDNDGNPVAPLQNLNFGDRVFLSGDFPGAGTGDGSGNTTYEYLGTAMSNVDLRNQDYTDLGFWKKITTTQLIPEGNNLTDSDSVAFGGLVVRNEVTGEVEAYIHNALVTTSNGNVTLNAIENAVIDATADSAAESSGGSVWGGGQSIAVNSVIATNVVLVSAKAHIADSTVNGEDADMSGDDGNVTVNAQNTATVDATNHSFTSAGADGVGVVLAFNTIGYESQNVLYSTLDALIGTDIGDQQPASVEAYIENSHVTADGNILVNAENTAILNARLDAEATAAAVAFKGASAVAATGILASNMVATDARAYIDNSDTINAGGDVTVLANDEASIRAVTEMVTSSRETNDVGVGILSNLANTLLGDYQFTSNSGTQDLVFGDNVRLASDFAGTGTPEAVYRFMGDAKTGADLGSEVYDPNLGFWQEIDVTNVVPDGIFKALRTAFGITGGTAKSRYALVVRNDVEGEVEAFIDDATVIADGNISVTAVEAARITARENSIVSSGGSSNAKGGVIANNQVLSNANALITDSEITTTPVLGGDVVVNAQNVAQVNAETLTKTSGDTAVGVVVAFNAVGWDASNIFFNAFDTLLGTELLIAEQPVEAQAFISNSDVSADRDLSVTASTNEALFDLNPTFAQGSLGLDNASQGLDDAGNIDFDDDNDESDDDAFLEALRTEFASNGVELTGDLSVTTLAVDSEWFLTDSSITVDIFGTDRTADTDGTTYTIKREGSALKVSRGSILNAQAGNEATANTTNDRVLVDAVAAAGNPENKGKAFEKLKFGTNGVAAGGILATNRASSLTNAFIDEVGVDFSSTDTIDRLLRGDRVQLANLDIYEYIGAPRVVPTDFTYLTLTQPDEVVLGDRVRLTTDTGGGTLGDIYEYSGPTLTPDFLAVTEDHVTSVTPTDLVRGDLVRIDTAATDTGVTIGEVYEYLGNDASNGFEYQSTDMPAELLTGERVQLLSDIGGGLTGEIYIYLGEDIENAGLRGPDVFRYGSVGASTSLRSGKPELQQQHRLASPRRRPVCAGLYQCRLDPG